MRFLIGTGFGLVVGAVIFNPIARSIAKKVWESIRKVFAWAVSKVRKQ